MDRMTRRSFLKISALSSLALCPCSLLFRPSAFAASLPGSENYYLARKQELTRDFIDTLQGVDQMLTPELGARTTRIITQQAQSRFEDLLPSLPDVGGEKNPDTQYLVVASWYVALYAPMQEAGKTAKDVGKLVYDLNLYSLKQYPLQKARAEQEKLFSPAGLAETRDWASWTQKKEYAGNWVAHYLPSNGSDFDFGIDYTECGLVKYFSSQAAPELAPYVCLNDFPRSRVQGTGLRRSKTLANGDGVCNFRYKKNRPVEQDWASEIGGIRQRS